jgi:hypothetical protein
VIKPHRHAQTRDDLIDAFACAVAARGSTSRFVGGEVDISGLQMQINC